MLNFFQNLSDLAKFNFCFFLGSFLLTRLISSKENFNRPAQKRTRLWLDKIHSVTEKIWTFFRKLSLGQKNIILRSIFCFDLHSEAIMDFEPSVFLPPQLVDFFLWKPVEWMNVPFVHEVTGENNTCFYSEKAKKIPARTNLNTPWYAWNFGSICLYMKSKHSMCFRFFWL